MEAIFAMFAIFVDARSFILLATRNILYETGDSTLVYGILRTSYNLGEDETNPPPPPHPP